MNYLIYIIISLLILSYGCGQNQDTTEVSSEARTPVTITSVRNEPIIETVELNAVSGFLKKNIIKSNATGLVESIEINLGDNVEKGQLLFTIRTKEALALEKSTINDTSIRFKGIIKILSSKSGIISTIAHQKGDYVQEGDELAIVSEQGSLVFMLEVPFEIRDYVKKNDPCEIILSDRHVITGTISSNLPVMDVQSQTESFIVKPGSTEKLPENLIGKVKVIKSSKQHAMVLSKEAVLADETQSLFWVMKLINDSTAVKIPVKKGIEDKDRVEILEPAFKNSDRIVLEGNYGLSDTARISIKK